MEHCRALNQTRVSEGLIVRFLHCDVLPLARRNIAGTRATSYISALLRGSVVSLKNYSSRIKARKFTVLADEQHGSVPETVDIFQPPAIEHRQKFGDDFLGRVRHREELVPRPNVADQDAAV